MTTTQTQPKTDAKPNPVIANGAANAAKTADVKPDIKSDAKPDAGTDADAEAKRTSRKVYIVTGEIREFKNAAEAEKFLNSDPTAPTTYTAIKGLKIERTQKVSLR